MNSFWFRFSTAILQKVKQSNGTFNELKEQSVILEKDKHIECATNLSVIYIKHYEK